MRVSSTTSEWGLRELISITSIVAIEPKAEVSAWMKQTRRAAVYMNSSSSGSAVRPSSFQISRNCNAVRLMYDCERKRTHPSLLQISVLGGMKRIRGEREPGPWDGVVVAFGRWFIPNGTLLTNNKLIAFAISTSVRQWWYRGQRTHSSDKEYKVFRWAFRSMTMAIITDVRIRATWLCDCCESADLDAVRASTLSGWEEIRNKTEVQRLLTCLRQHRGVYSRGWFWL